MQTIHKVGRMMVGILLRYGLLCVLLSDQFSDGLKLHVTGTFVNGTNLCVPEELLLGKVAGESDTAHEVYTLGCEGLSDFCKTTMIGW